MRHGQPRCPGNNQHSASINLESGVHPSSRNTTNKATLVCVKLSAHTHAPRHTPNVQLSGNDVRVVARSVPNESHGRSRRSRWCVVPDWPQFTRTPHTSRENRQHRAAFVGFRTVRRRLFPCGVRFRRARDVRAIGSRAESVPSSRCFGLARASALVAVVCYRAGGGAAGHAASWLPSGCRRCRPERPNSRALSRDVLLATLQPYSGQQLSRCRLEGCAPAERLGSRLVRMTAHPIDLGFNLVFVAGQNGQISPTFRGDL